MQATADKTTLVNMAHHTYWNLAGHGVRHDPRARAPAASPTATPRATRSRTARSSRSRAPPSTSRRSRSIGKDLKEAGGTPIGFDHNFVVNGEPNKMRPVARLKDPKSGRVHDRRSGPAGRAVLHAATSWTGPPRARARPTPQYSGLCLETQKFPNSINVPAWKNEVILKPGQTLQARDGAQVHGGIAKTMRPSLSWGIIGTGGIAGDFAEALAARQRAAGCRAWRALRPTKAQGLCRALQAAVVRRVALRAARRSEGGGRLRGDPSPAPRGAGARVHRGRQARALREAAHHRRRRAPSA